MDDQMPVYIIKIIGRIFFSQLSSAGRAAHS